MFYPIPLIENNDRFIVGFYGGFIPLQGVQKIIEAARLLKSNNEIVFDLAGNGFEYDRILALKQKYDCNNVVFHNYLPYEKLPAFINKFDLALGIFGDTLKSDLVIPNKIFHYAACSKCIITKKTPAIAEVFAHNQNIIMIDNNPEKIAEAILLLKAEKSERLRIGSNAGDLVRASFDEVSIAKRFLVSAKKCLH